VRALARLRRDNLEFQTGDHFFYNDWDQYQSRGVLLFSRSNANRFSLVALNFTNTDQTVRFTFPKAGAFQEMLHGQDNFQAAAGQEQWLTVPSNYGRIWTA